jgi:flagellar basal body rod protein FlgG
MYGASAADAYGRIGARAQDLRDAFVPGGVPLHGDVAAGARALTVHDPLSVALPPGAWLVARGADGRRAYGRDGALTLEDGVLRTRDGAEVLGYPGGDARGAVPVPLRVSEADRVLGRTADAHIEPDGTVAYSRTAIDPRTGERTQERVAIGRIALARFPAGTQPARLDAAHVAAPAGVAPHLGTPGDGAFAQVVPFSRDAGGVDFDAGIERLNESYRQFQAMGAAVRTRASVEKTTLDLVK